MSMRLLATASLLALCSAGGLLAQSMPIYIDLSLELESPPLGQKSYGFCWAEEFGAKVVADWRYRHWIHRADSTTNVLVDSGMRTTTYRKWAEDSRSDLRNDGVRRQVAWTVAQSDTAFLAFDRNANGLIDSGAELFGNATLLASGIPAAHGFEALAELDDNHDGVLDPSDHAWALLLVWTDRDHDGVCTADELQPIAATGVRSLELSLRDHLNKRDRWGNVFR